MPALNGKEVGPIGFGLMGMTVRDVKPSDDELFPVFRRALELGANFWNGGQLYGPPDANSLQLLNRYYTKYPEDAEKTVISIKAWFDEGFTANSTPEFTRKSIEDCLKQLDGKHSLDLYELARFDGKTPIEDTLAVIVEYVKAGKIGGISLSEVSANTIRKANKIHPISSVEVELSLFSTDILTNGVLETCAELGIPVIAYAPFSRGFLTGQVRSRDDLGSDLKQYPRFSEENFPKNMKLVEALEKIAHKKNVALTQLAIAWVLQQGEKYGATIIPIPGTLSVKRLEENLAHVTLEKDELDEIDGILKSMEVVGNRYFDGVEQLSFQ